MTSHVNKLYSNNHLGVPLEGSKLFFLGSDGLLKVLMSLYHLLNIECSDVSYEQLQGESEIRVELMQAQYQ